MTPHMTVPTVEELILESEQQPIFEKTAVTFDLADHLLAQLDARSAKTGLSRDALLVLGVNLLLGNS